MFVVKISVEARNFPAEEMSDLLNLLLGAWRKNGQLQTQNRAWGIYAQDGFYSAIVLTPTPDALDEKNNNIYVQKHLAAFNEKNLPLPTVEILGEDIDGCSSCSCSETNSYILFNSYVSLESVIRCGECFNPVPLYTIPHLAHDEYYEIMCWAHDYECCDSLQMNCRTLERAGMREMSDVDSSLSKQGLEICRGIGDKTGISTYYYLCKHKGRSLQKEKARKCPSCGGEWLLDQAWHDQFDFRCDRCCLLSNIAFEVRSF